MKSNKYQLWSQNRVLLGFLVFSIAIAVTIVSCNKEEEIIIPDTPNVNPHPTLASSAIKALFMAAGKGATSSIVGTATGWLLGGLGLSDNSPDYTEELAKINQSLQQIMGQLNGIHDQLAEINQQLQILNCSQQQTSLTEQTGRIDYLSALYKGYISTAENGGRVSNAILSDWVDQVLAQGAYTSQTPMGQILTTMSNLLVQPQSGAVRACVAAVVPPEDDTFDDDYYYYKVVQFTNFYYYYQALGLMLLNESLHYKAWEAAFLANGDIYSSDSVSAVCGDENAAVFCTQAATFTNTVYNALIEQFTIAGAPYTNHEVLMQNHSTQPLLWVKSLESFSAVAGDACSYPLSSVNNRCGITVGRFDDLDDDIQNVVFNEHSDWQIADASDLNRLLSGWTEGRAWEYTNSLGFGILANKIIITPDTTSISLRNSGSNQMVVKFIDMTAQKHWIDNKLYDNSDAFDRITRVQTNTWVGSCAPFQSQWYIYTSYGTWPYPIGLTCDWYTGIYGLAEYCGGNLIDGQINWNDNASGNAPAWSTLSITPNAEQFRLLHTDVTAFGCTEGRPPKNAGNVWTMCGDDFTEWFEINVPRPETCDIPGAGGIPCNL
ncbi:MAG: hypothetical protein GY746_01790 [Gammaproteobacteria bacterium]|nr:hypothetical protein [Gammaproteobacteria bacterium]